MDTRRVSAAIGFTLLLACVIVVIMIIYNGGSTRTSYRTSMEESWKKRDISMKGRQEVLGTNFISTTSESTVQEAKKLADELQKLFTIKTGGASHKRVNGRIAVVDMGEEKANQEKLFPPKHHQGESTPVVVLPTSGLSLLTRKTQLEMTSEKPTSPMPSSPQSFFTTKSHTTPTTTTTQHPDHSEVDGDVSLESEKHATPVSRPMLVESEKHSEENDHHYTTSRNPSINSRTVPKNIRNQLQLATSTSNHPPSGSNILLVKSSASAPPSSGGIPHDRGPGFRRHHYSTSMSSAIPSRSQMGERYSNDDEGNIRPNRGRPYSHSQPSTMADNRFGEPGTEGDWAAEEEEEESQPDVDYGTKVTSPYGTEYSKSSVRDPLKAMGNMIQLVTDVYKRGRDGLDVAGFLRVINETVQRSNNNNLLSQLNQMYARHGNWSTALFPQKSEVVGRNALENSLSAFVFMSFGIFLLNQIHSFMGTGSLDGNLRQGRKLDYALDDSELNFLFEPPPPTPFETPNATHDLLNISDDSGVAEFTTISDIVNDSSTIANLEGADNTGEKKRDSPEEKMLPNPTQSGTRDSFNISNYVNNMFRAGINLVNAYTKKDTQALDCIWSKYCQDLDKTSAEHGSLYSIAARINSVGLRLLLGQLPAELTVDVLLRSLLAWDGLPCVKMFSECNLVHGQLLRATTTEKEMNSTVPSGMDQVV